MNWKTKRVRASSSGMPEIDEVVRQQISRDIERHLERKFLSATTSTVEPESLPALDGNQFLKDCERFIREARQNQIIIIVDAALSWDSPLLLEQTLCDGQRIEMSHRQANELHQMWPLKLHNVLSSERAEFVPASRMDADFIPNILPAPPYTVLAEPED